MKKIATIFTIAFGLLLWVLNFNMNSSESAKHSNSIFNITSNQVELKEESENAINLPQLDLPSIFEAIFRSL